MKFGFKNYYLSLFYSFLCSLFTFDHLAAIFGIAGLVGFVFFVSAAKGTSSINTSAKKDI
ncbi:Conserved hypothetical protein [Prochlorococcus marinus subsp. pastoris str. CCMP1986]|uniref:Uncharacterized protein n=1 Tax=Prochlorococcus marinus subsp. pastoris (strain CCMP1986 / NIES-2087 / MED4) TaxID=59919 RepID=A8WIJ9_PROMP|nr:hypothetical protein [Prochlorococcus marinus]KGF87053.1 hypothetical protein PROCH_0639 [Prochlorococcus marinus str. EQPAC1]CAP16487.1 Conserved hypothetical protein [Prochlorococcus marinus subsp. pastoris str. CCMP1986]